MEGNSSEIVKKEKEKKALVSFCFHILKKYTHVFTFRSESRYYSLLRT